MDNALFEMVEDVFSEKPTKEYSDMVNFIAKKYDLKLKTSEKYFNQLQGYKNNIRVISFFNSLHRLKQCKYCRRMHMRITSKGEFNSCMFFNTERIDFRHGNVRENILKALEKHYEFE